MWKVICISVIIYLIVIYFLFIKQRYKYEHVDLTKDYYHITVATKPHVILDILRENTRGDIIALGLDLNKDIGWKNNGSFGLKIQLIKQFVDSIVNKDAVILFNDAYDVGYYTTADEILNRFSQFDKPIVFGAEIYCHPDNDIKDKYPQVDKEFKYLNSGLFIGKVYALQYLLSDYVYNDSDDDQRYWTDKFLNNQDMIELDYTNKIFLNCAGIDKNDIEINENKIYYKDKNPLLIHANGKDKSYLNL